MFALIYRNHFYWGTQSCLKAALDFLGAKYEYFDNNDLFSGVAVERLKTHTKALVIDDGFALQTLPGLPKDAVFIAADFHNDFDKHYAENMWQFRKFYCYHRIGIEIAEKEGYEVEWLPMAWDSIRVPYIDVVRDLPVFFASSDSTERRVKIKEHLEQVYGVETFGGYDDTGRRGIFHEEMASYICRSLVGVNDSGRTHVEENFGTDVNQRNFEVMGCGAMLLASKLKVPHFYEMGYRPGFEFIEWDGWDDFVDKLAFYTDPKHDDFRWGVAQLGMEHTQANHTYVQRMRRVLEEMGELP